MFLWSKSVSGLKGKIGFWLEYRANVQYCLNYNGALDFMDMAVMDGIGGEGDGSPLGALA